MSYTHIEIIHNTKAAKEVVPILMQILKPKSVVDIGCGIGTWLTVFEEFGVRNVVGIDGEYVDRNLLHIDENKFIPYDLTKPFKLNKKFDLVVCLEVAEHIPEVNADTFIESLISLGDFILFSAAVPNQGGQNHINEQWPSYWQAKFKQHKFELHDCIRSAIWLNENIEWWYKQNIFLAVKEDTNFSPKIYNLPHNIIHPDLYSRKNRQLESLNLDLKKLNSGDVSMKTALRIFLKSLKKKISASFRKPLQG